MTGIDDTATPRAGGANPAGAPVRVLLIEDDAPTRAHILAALDGDAGFTVKEGGTLSEGLAGLDWQPRVILCDLNLPDGTGIALIREARRRLPEVDIMVVSVMADEASVLSAIRVGAMGYILKDAFPNDIAAAVHDLVRGHSPISASIARYIVRNAQLPAGDEPCEPAIRLTPREADILWGIAKGYRYAEIAAQLGISPQTVTGYIKTIYRKLHVTNRGEAVFEAVQQGLIKL
ncbi:response regulator [Polymorphum gilvum]|uniref:Two component transcriptional regulator, LuxR family n=1 Tax=Polymorphum gilvum (strain LMG 25793 / CGMCC 1.9160 / SL003B-26A1) TaxID=991905 RepID=F2IY45_POLGS|nr:response regulator transcription factor [Polymorphum gilvum]ADZ70548.1 Two component transcriptional regulator, LuxR family [Polymorphum gilvum SL003B-26A1]